MLQCTAYHPQTDSQFEVVNSVLQHYLRCFVADCPKRWSKILHWEKYSYNTSFHTSLTMSPFKVVRGRDPPYMLDYVPMSAKTEVIDKVLLDRQELLQQLKQNLEKAQGTMKQLVDTRRCSESFKVGDHVLVKLQPYRQITVAIRHSNKLFARYFGPFLVLKRIGSVAYKLALPPTARIHDVFHVSLLKLFWGPISNQPLPFPHEIFQSHPILEPHLVLQERKLTIQGTAKTQILVWWQGLPSTAATWEDKDDFKLAFPDFNLEDKVEVDGGSMIGMRLMKVKKAELVIGLRMKWQLGIKS